MSPRVLLYLLPGMLLPGAPRVVKRCRGVGLLCGPRAESLPSLIGEECPALPWLPCPVLLPWRASEAALVLFWERQKSPAGRWNQP